MDLLLQPSQWLLLSILIVLLLLIAYRSYRQMVARTEFMKQHQCQRAGPSYPGFKILFGYDFLMRNVVDVINHKFAKGNAERHDLYGPTYWSRILIKEVINTVEPENLEVVFKTRAEDYRLIDARQKLMETFYGNGIIGNSGQAWKRSRSLVHPAVTNMTQAVDITVLEEHAANLIMRIRQTTGSFNFAELAYGYSLDISSRYFFGESTYSLAPRDERLNQFAKDFTLLGKMSRTLTIFNRQFPWLRKAMFWHDYHSTTTRTKEFVDEYIDRAHGKGNTLVENIVAQTQNKEEARGEVLNTLLASRDTVGVVLSELFYLLARNPRVWAKLREEVKSISGAPTLAALNKLIYLKHVMNEVHGRIAVRDTVLPRGGGDGSEPLFVPKGGYVVYTLYKLNRNRAVFGEDVEDFRPERWESIKPSTFEYMPFSAGPRQCPGKQMAMMMMTYAVVRIAQEFEHITPMDDRPWEEGTAFSFFNRHGINIAM